MSWIATIDSDVRAATHGSIGHGRMRRGSIVLETKASPQDRPQVLFSMRFPGQTRSELTIQAVPGGGVHFLFAREQDSVHFALPQDAEDQADVIRLTYAWDLQQNLGRLSLERPGTSKIFLKTFANPLPLTGQELLYLSERPKRQHFHSEFCYLAVSTEVVPIGPMPVICPRTPVQTLYGAKYAGDLKRGDLVTTLAGESVPVLQVLRRTVPAMGSFTPVRLRAPFFGLHQDIVLAQEARLVVGGSQVEYLFGTDNVLVPVKHLTSGSSARFEAGHPLVTYVQLLLPDHEALVLGGTAVESLNIGRIRRKQTIFPATMLQDFDPLTIPEHSKLAFPVLKHFEAVTLAEHRAA